MFFETLTILRLPFGSNRGYIDPEIAIKLAKLGLLTEQKKQSNLNPAIGESLARLKQLEEKKSRDEEEAAFLAPIEERKRKGKPGEAALLLQYQAAERGRGRQGSRG